MKKLLIALALAPGLVFGGEVLKGAAAVAKFPESLRSGIETSKASWTELRSGVEYSFAHFTDLYGYPNDVHVLRMDYAQAPIQMRIIENSTNEVVALKKKKTSDAAAEANALFAVNGTMYNSEEMKPVYWHKVDGRIIVGDEKTDKVAGLAFNPDKSYDFSGANTIDFKSYDNIISCDAILHNSINTVKEYSWSTNAPSAGFPLWGMTPGKILYLVVIDGRRPGVSVGINYSNSAELLKTFGCSEGVLFDGGGSTTLAMRNDVVPSDDFTTTQFVPENQAGYHIMNYVNAGSSRVEREVIDQIVFLADPQTVTNNFRVTPYVQHPATNAMSLLWVTTTNTAATVRWWPKGNKGAVKSASVTPRQATELDYFGYSHAQQYLPAMIPWQYRYRIENLQPDAEYEYEVVLVDGERYAKNFRTAPAEFRPIRFIAYSDSETQPKSTGEFATWEDVREDGDTNAVGAAGCTRKYYVDQTTGYASNVVLVASRKPDFIVAAGDLAEKGSDQTHWDEYWRHNAGKLNDPAGSIPILAAPGNHEYHGYFADDDCGERGMRKYLSYFEFEPNGTSLEEDRQERFHRVDYGPVAMIFIDPNNGPDGDKVRDTNYYLQEKTCRAPDFNEGSVQYQWLEKQLADAQKNKLFTFLVCHQCPFSVGYHGRVMDEKGTEQYGEDLSGAATRCLTNLVFKYGVDGWICGHDEIYEHSQISGTEVLPDGTQMPHTVNVYDVGIAGDGLRGCRRTTVPNPYEVFRAHVDATEVYDADGTLVSGGKHYGHLEVNVEVNDAGLWTATLTPVYNFVSKNAKTGAIFMERRTYPDEMVLTNSVYGKKTVDLPSPKAPTGLATVTLAESSAVIGTTLKGQVTDIAAGHTPHVFVAGAELALADDGSFSFVVSSRAEENQVTVSLVRDDAWYVSPGYTNEQVVVTDNGGGTSGDIVLTEDGQRVFIDLAKTGKWSNGKIGVVEYAAEDLWKGIYGDDPATQANGSRVCPTHSEGSLVGISASAAGGFVLTGSGYGDTTYGPEQQEKRDTRDLSIAWPIGDAWGDSDFGATTDERVVLRTDMVKKMGKSYERLAPTAISTDGTHVYGNNYYQPELYELAVLKSASGAITNMLCTGRYWTLPARASALAIANVAGKDVLFVSCENGEFLSVRPADGAMGNNDVSTSYTMLSAYRQMNVTGRTSGNLHLLCNTIAGEVTVYAIAADGSGLASTTTPLATINTSSALIKPIANGFAVKDDETKALMDYNDGKKLYLRTIANTTVAPPQPEPTVSHAITIAEPQNGTVETSVTNAVAGTEVTVFATPAEHYTLEKITTNGVVLAGTSFAMPDNDVTVAATFKEMTGFTVKVVLAGGKGTVVVPDVGKKLYVGDTVTGLVQNVAAGYKAYVVLGDTKVLPVAEDGSFSGVLGDDEGKAESANIAVSYSKDTAWYVDPFLRNTVNTGFANENSQGGALDIANDRVFLGTAPGQGSPGFAEYAYSELNTSVDPDLAKKGGFCINTGTEYWGRSIATIPAFKVVLSGNGMVRGSNWVTPYGNSAVPGTESSTAYQVATVGVPEAYTNDLRFLPVVVDADSHYMYGNYYKNSKSIHQFEIVADENDVTKVGKFVWKKSWTLPAKGGSGLAIARIGGKDILYTKAGDSGKLMIIDTTTEKVIATSALRFSGTAYGMQVTGVADGTPHLVIGSGYYISVYGLAADGLSLVSRYAIAHGSSKDLLGLESKPDRIGLAAPDDEVHVYAAVGQNGTAVKVLEKKPAYMIVRGTFGTEAEALDDLPIAYGDSANVVFNAPSGKKITGVKVNGVADTNFTEETYTFTTEALYNNVYIAMTVEGAPIAKIGDVTYESLDAAFKAAVAGDKVEMLADVALAETLTIDASRAATFDLGGHTLSLADGYSAAMMIDIAGTTMTITNGTVDTGAKQVNLRDDSVITVATNTLFQMTGTYSFRVNVATLNVYGEFINTTSDLPAIQLYTPGAVVNVYEGAHVCAKGDAIRVNFNNGTAYLNIYGGLVESNGGYPAIYAYKTGNTSVITITGGTIKTSDLTQGVIQVIKYHQTEPSYNCDVVVTPLTDACTAKFSTNICGWHGDDPDKYKTLAACCASGYEPVKGEDGYYTIQAKQSKPEPYTPIVVDNPEAKAQEINAGGTDAKKLVMAPPDGATVTDTYYGYFDAVPGVGQVTMELNESGTNAVVEAVKAADVAALDAVLGTTEATATMTVASPLAGFFYSLRQNATLTALDFTDKNKLGGKDEITFTLDKSKSSGFYQMLVTPNAVK